MSDFNVIEKGQPGNSGVLVIHGVLGSARNLFRLVETVAEAGFHVLAYDQRGHGNTSRASSPEGYSLRALGADVFSVMDKYGMESAHLVGHSLGARVSLAATSLAPKRVKSLSMLDAGIRIAPDSERAIREIVDPLPFSFASKEEAERFLSRHSPALHQWLFSNLRTREGGRLEWVFDLNGIREYLLKSLAQDQTEAWRALTIPTMVLRGGNSDHFRQAEFEEMLALNPRAEGAIVRNAGHWLHVDNFADTSEYVVRFLKKGTK